MHLSLHFKGDIRFCKCLSNFHRISSEFHRKVSKFDRSDVKMIYFREILENFLKIFKKLLQNSENLSEKTGYFESLRGYYGHQNLTVSKGVGSRAGAGFLPVFLPRSGPGFCRAPNSPEIR